MADALTDFEVEILNKLIPTQSLGNPPGLKMVIRNLVMEQKDYLTKLGLSDHDFSQLISQTGTRIFQFLRDNEFYYEREGGVFYLTEKGKQLRTHGTLQKYMEWRTIQHTKTLSEIDEIKTQGFITEHQEPIVKEEQEKKKKRFGFF